MFRPYLPFLLVVLLLTFSVLPAHSGTGKNISSSIQESYQKAKFYYNQLETDQKLGAKRDLWIKGAGNFRKVYLANPKSELAPASLYMLGKIYSRMYDKFHLQKDLQESVGYFTHILKGFEDHPVWSEDPKRAVFKEASVRTLDMGYAGSLGYAAAGALADFIIVDMLSQAATGQLTPDEAMQQAEKQANRYYRV